MPNPDVPARSTMRLWLGALLVLGAMLPGTIVIPVVRSFVTAGWPGAEWLMHAFIAVNLLGAVVGGPLLAVKAKGVTRERVERTWLAEASRLLGPGFDAHPLTRLR